MRLAMAMGLLLGASHGWFSVDQRMVQAQPAFVSIYTEF